MANELPYFRFTVQAWQNGKIDIERNELKGLFISICGYYWIQDCSISLALLQKKFSTDLPLINELIDAEVIKVNRYENVEISFLNEQYDLLSEKRKRRQDAGSKGGNAKAMLKQNCSYKDKDNNKDKNDKDKDNRSVKFDFKKSLIEYGFRENLVNDWIEVRKNKKATNSKTAFDSFIKEIESRPFLDCNDILVTCCEKSWSGFKYSWLDNNSKPEQKNTFIDQAIAKQNSLDELFKQIDNKQIE